MITADVLFNGSLYHPLFNPNQVLTHTHLNRVIDYLEGQSRLTRVNAIGTGVLCGFVPTRGENNLTLHISKGCGITTEGYLVAEDEITLNRYGRALINANVFPNFAALNNPEVLELFQLGTEETPPQAFLERVNGNRLFGFGESAGNGAPILSSVLQDKIPVLLIEINDKKEGGFRGKAAGEYAPPGAFLRDWRALSVPLPSLPVLPRC